MTDGWKDRMGAALAEGGCQTQTEWLAKHPGKHCWFVFDLSNGELSCAACGKVKLDDESKQKPCVGIVTVGPR